jgi:TRAP transporter 4TM/12TM fusion protein
LRLFQEYIMSKPASSPISEAPEAPEADETISQEKVNEIIEEFENESTTRKLTGFWRVLAGVLCVGLSVYALYWTQYSITTHVYRASFLMIVLVLTYLYYPLVKRDQKRLPIYDLVLAGLSIVSLVYLLTVYESALQRITRPTPAEVAMGAILMILIVEATRRTTGWSLAVITLGFLLYAFLGPYMPEPFDHRGYGLPRIVGQNYLTLEGIFGVPLDVAATFIVLFTIYGAVLEYSGAGKFFLDWAFAAMGRSNSGAGPGRTVTAAGFLLGTVSGSGVATTVTLGALAWPMLKRAGYDRNTAGGILSAAGLGAILSPPTLGAAAFLIAEYLNISYLQVLVMATIPTALYYLSCFLMIEADSRRMKTHSITIETLPFWELTFKYGYHFTSLFAVAILMSLGMTAFMAVFWSIVIAFALSFLRPETRLASLWAAAAGAALTAVLWLGFHFRPPTACFWGIMLTAAIAAGIVIYRSVKRMAGAVDSHRIIQALESGGRSVLSVAATTACAGIIVSIVTLTGLGLKISGLIVNLGGGNPLFTVAFAALAIWVLGLAVPVTASYIIAVVMVVPALAQVGVPEAAAHMFIFYYAVLSDVSPPTALSPFAAAAITGGKPYPTMMMAWKYCLPAFLVPFMFTLSPDGLGLLLLWDQVSWLTIAWVFFTACVAVGALSVGFGGWFVKDASLVERILFGVSGLALLAADVRFDGIGFVFLMLGVALHLWRVRRALRPALA